MPIKPHKGESQSDFMGRCMHELGQSDTERPQDQKVAICMSAWRDAHGGEPPKKSCDPNDYDDDEHEEFMADCIDEGGDEDECAMRWNEERGAKPPVQRVEHKPLYHKTHSGTVQEMEFVMSDETVDRMGDVISASGWELENFHKNPVCLFNHRADFPIGRWKNLRAEKGALRGYLQLAPEGTSPRIDEIRRLVEAGILCSVSVGFHPLESEPLDKKAGSFGGMRFLKQELIETSLVSVPANPNALAIAKSLGVSSATIDVVFAKHGNREDVRTRDFTAKHGNTSHDRRGRIMPEVQLSQRIIDLQQQIANLQEGLQAHLDKMDDTNVSDADMQKTNDYNARITQMRNNLAGLIESEKNLAASVDSVVDQRRQRALATTSMSRDPEIVSPAILRQSKKDWEPIDYLVHAGVCHALAKICGTSPHFEMTRIYGNDDAHKTVLDWTMRAAAAPAMTTVAGWAQELVHQIYADMMALLLPQSVFPRFSAKGMTLSFGNAGKILLPTRSATPSIAGSFVGEGMAIPVRQGAFTSQTFTPKKMGVITTWTREMGDHSIPAIEGVLREAIQQDTAISLDSVLLDANAATTIRPAGLLNGVGATTATAGGGVAAVVGDIKALLGSLVTATKGNVRSPVWLMNPVDMLSASLVFAANTGTFPFRDEIGRGTLNNIPIIDSATVTAKTVILTDAADFVVMQGDNVRFDISDQATLHMEDTNPLDLVSGSPGVVASPQRSLFQTDSLALRMVFPVNWAFRRSGMVSWTQNVTW
jgi:HK97 family phage prohead protease